jgi:hypothetical protein
MYPNALPLEQKISVKEQETLVQKKLESLAWRAPQDLKHLDPNIENNENHSLQKYQQCLLSNNEYVQFQGPIKITIII